MSRRLFYDFDQIGLNKDKQFVSGDSVLFARNENCVTFVIADGMGSGVKANISSIFYSHKLLKLVELGFSRTDSVIKVINEISSGKIKNSSYVAFNLCRIYNDGWGSIINYQAPHPIVSSLESVYVPQYNERKAGSEKYLEFEVKLNEGDKLFVFTDGVSQAGIGVAGVDEWDEKVIASELSMLNNADRDIGYIVDRVRTIGGKKVLDDITVCSLKARYPAIVNIMTGPPKNQTYDNRIVKEFVDLEGYKIVSGGTTMDIVARVTGNRISEVSLPDKPYMLPEYSIEGIDLCTEGAVTLNRVFNLLNNRLYEPSDPLLMRFVTYLNLADIVNIYHGRGSNSGHNETHFIEQGIVSRQKTVDLITKVLKSSGKIVKTVEY